MKNKITALDYIILIAIGVILLTISTLYTNKRDYNTALSYDGCYEQYMANEMPSELFRSFMTNCMK